MGYVVFWNLSLQMNSVGFYQLSKIMVLPTVATLEVTPITLSLQQGSHHCCHGGNDKAASHVHDIITLLWLHVLSIVEQLHVHAIQMSMTGKKLTRLECAAIALVILGVVLATVSDSTVTTNVLGMVLSVAAILFSAVYQVKCVAWCLAPASTYADSLVTLHACAATTTFCLEQVWIGTKQKELQAGSMQLMHQYCPWAAGLLAILVPVFEPMGFISPQPDTILGFQYSPMACIAIFGSAVRAESCSCDSIPVLAG